MESQGDKNSAVTVVGIVAGVSLVIAIAFLIFAPERLGIAGWMVTVLAVMGAIVAPLVRKQG